MSNLRLAKSHKDRTVTVFRRALAWAASSMASLQLPDERLRIFERVRSLLEEFQRDS